MKFKILALGLILIARPVCAAVIFSEDFSDILGGWTLGPEWQIGAAVAGPQPPSGFPGPSQDTSPGGDNGIAGTVIGGNITTSTHDFYYLTSPAFDTAGKSDLWLEFQSWMNLDFWPYMQARVEVFDGTDWVTIFATGGAPAITNSSWQALSFDISDHANDAMQVRFGHAVTTNGAFTMSGWHLDDVTVTGVPEPTSATFFSFAVGAMVFGRRRRSCPR